MGKNRTWKDVKDELDKLLSDNAVIAYIDIIGNDTFYVHYLAGEDEGYGVGSRCA